MTINAGPHSTWQPAIVLYSTDAGASLTVGRDEFREFANAIKRGDLDNLLRGEVSRDPGAVRVPPSGHRDLGVDTAPLDEQVASARGRLRTEAAFAIVTACEAPGCTSRIHAQDHAGWKALTDQHALDSGHTGWAVVKDRRGELVGRGV